MQVTCELPISTTAQPTSRRDARVSTPVSSLLMFGCRSSQAHKVMVSDLVKFLDRQSA